jgi:hypothetical protein
MDDAQRDRLKRIQCDVLDALRAIEGGRPIPEHIAQRHDMGKAAAWRMIRRDPDDD